MQVSAAFDSVVFSSAISDIEVRTNSYFVDFEIEIADDVVFSVRLFPYNGSVTFYDLRSIVEEIMLRYGLPFAKVFVYITDGANEESIAFDVIYSSLLVAENTESFLANHFLTTLKAKRTFRSSRESLCFFAREGEDTTERYKVTLRYGNQYRTVDVSERPEAQEEDGVNWILPFYDNVKRLVGNMELEGYVDIDPEIANAWDDIVAWTAYVGNRSVTFYLDDGYPNISLSFKNAFNVFESAHLKGESTTKHKVSKSTARIGSRFVKYDVRFEDSQEFESEPLSQEEANWLVQLYESRNVLLDSDYGASTDILIEEGDFSVIDSDEEPPRAKFTWRYVEDRMRISGDSHSRIFTNHYDRTFA